MSMMITQAFLICFNCNFLNKSNKLKDYNVYHGPKYLIINSKIKDFYNIKKKIIFI